MSGTVGNNTGTRSGQIEAVQGVTTSSGDPATDTNNGILGEMFVNTTSGEMYICTDITADSNVWINVGDGTGHIT
tara:strand:- start:84 stop:308 length:225 start_codon:yes stop_codon:yes gene_type:complete